MKIVGEGEEIGEDGEENVSSLILLLPLLLLSVFKRFISATFSLF